MKSVGIMDLFLKPENIMHSTKGGYVETMLGYMKFVEFDGICF
jgi:hypothetical protein